MSADFTADNVSLLKRLQPEQFYEQFLSEGCYPDGRDIAKHRHSAIQCGGATGGHQGSAYVQQGGAHVSCSVQLSLAPDSDDPLVRWEMQAMDAVPKPLLEHAQAHLAKIFDTNLLLDPLKLRVTTQSTAGAGGKFELRWGIQLEIVVLSTDGFLLDAVLTAVQAALLDTRVPTRVEYVEAGADVFVEADDFLLGEEVPRQFDIEKVRVLNPDKENRPMELRQFLAYIPFLLYRSNECKDEDERILLCDPTADLCSMISDRCEVIIGAGDKLHSLTFSVSIGAMDQALLDEMMVLAKRRYTAISNSLKQCSRKSLS